MLNLSTTSSVIRAITGSAGAIDVSYSYVDVTQTSPAPSGFSGGALTQITTATTTTLVAAPASSTTRNVTGLIVANDHASVNNVVEIQHYDGTNAVRLWKGTLGVSERVVLDASGYWTYYGSDGTAKSTGVLLGQVYGSVSADSVSTPDAATTRFYAAAVAGRITPKYILPDGTQHTFQDKLSEKGLSAYYPNNGASLGTSIGMAFTSGGTISHPTPGAGLYAQTKRTRFACVVTTTNQFLGVRTAATEKRYWRGNASGQGGFDFHARIAIGAWPAATVRLFCGLTTSTVGYAISDTLAGSGVGFYHDTTESASTLSFLSYDGTTPTKTAITLGSALAAGAMFDAFIWCKPNDSVVYYRLVDLLTGTTLVDSSTSTTLPPSTSFLGPEISMSNGTANTAAAGTSIEILSYQCHSEL